MCTSGHLFYSAVMPLSGCADVASLVLLAQKFSNSEDPVFKTLFPSLARAACSAYHWVYQRILVLYGDHRFTKFKSYPSTGLPCSLKNREVQILCTCPARAMYTPGQLFIQRRDGHVEMCQCTKFGVTGSKYHKLGGSHVISSGERMREMELFGHVCLYVCSSIRHLEHERVVRLGRVSILSMHRKG